MSAPCITRYDFTVEFDQVDLGGVMYHANYLVAFDRARGRHLETLSVSFKSLWDKRRTLAVAHAQVKFRRPVLYGAQVSILTRLTLSSRISVVAEQSLFESSALSHDPAEWQSVFDVKSRSPLSCLNTMTLVTLDLDTMKSCSLPEELANALGNNVSSQMA